MITQSFRIFIIFLASLIFQNSFALSNEVLAKEDASWIEKKKQLLNQIWTQGHNDLYLSGYAWHNRYTYSEDKFSRYNERAWGGGVGKSLYDKDGNLHTLSAIAFLDSHKNIEPAVGYTFFKMAQLDQNVRVGAGYSLFLTSRADMIHSIPFPGLLPWLTMSYKQASLMATYIPGTKDNGNVLFILAKWTLDKL